MRQESLAGVPVWRNQPKPWAHIAAASPPRRCAPAPMTPHLEIRTRNHEGARGRSRALRAAGSLMMRSGGGRATPPRSPDVAPCMAGRRRGRGGRGAGEQGLLRHLAQGCEGSSGASGSSGMQRTGAGALGRTGGCGGGGLSVDRLPPLTHVLGRLLFYYILFGGLRHVAPGSGGLSGGSGGCGTLRRDMWARPERLRQTGTPRQTFLSHRK